MISSRQSFSTVTQHIPDKRFQMVRYYGWYSNRAKETAANESAATAEQGCGAQASAAVGIIERDTFVIEPWLDDPMPN